MALVDARLCMSGISNALVFAILFYHLGCYIEFKLDLKDTARVVPVHAWRWEVI